jgi:stage V sporulation protein R
MQYKLEDLEVWDEKICSIAKKYGLDWYEIEYESIDFYSMLGAMAFHGMPSHYNHWSFGKSFERTHQMYNLGMEGLPYELIINSNPSIAYLMRENPLYLQVLIMAHCVGHSDFFKNNRSFRSTRADTVIGRNRAAKKRIQGYVEDPSIGIDKVEEVLDACHAIQFQVSKPGTIRRSRDEIIEEYKFKKEKDSDYPEIDLEKHPLEPDYDVMKFIAENGKMPEWKRDIIEICCDEGQYFWPQIQTKIMNEGWASYWHYTILHELDLPPELHVAFIKSHNQVIRPHIGGINPYHLGFHMFQRIKERMGIEECFIAREVHNDSSFLRQYLKQEDCEELNLFSYGNNRHGDTIVDEVSDEEGWKKVRERLVTQVSGGSIPILRIEDCSRDGTLALWHEHDGRDLEIKEAKEVMKHIKKLWNGVVTLSTVSDGKYEKFVC